MSKTLCYDPTSTRARSRERSGEGAGYIKSTINTVVVVEVGRLAEMSVNQFALVLALLALLNSVSACNA